MKFFKVMALAAFAVVISVAILAAPGYSITDSESSTAEAFVPPFLSITLSNDPVDFNITYPGTTSDATIGNGYPLTVTIGSETNVGPVTVGTRAVSTGFSDGSHSFGVSNMTWSKNESTWTVYSTADIEVCSGLYSSGTCNIYHRLTVPSGQASGTYSVGIVISASD